MPVVKYDSVVDAFVYGDWGCDLGDDINNPQDFIKKANREQLSMILLIDIARSLRVLRCPNFKGIPGELRAIRLQTRKPAKKRIKKV